MSVTLYDLSDLKVCVDESVGIYIGDWGHAKRGVMWGGNQMLDEWFQGEFGFGRSGVRVSGGSVSWATCGLHGGVGGYTVERSR